MTPRSDDQSPKRPRNERMVPSNRGERLRLEQHPRVPDHRDYERIREWARSRPRPWAIDLFCGAGGLSLGLQESGFSVIVSADADPTALESHSHNIEGLTWLGDLSDPLHILEQLDAWGINDIDLVAGGPPCQPFSRAGKSKIRSLVESGQRGPADPRSTLWRGFFDVVAALRPRAVIFENVPDFANVQNGSVLLDFMQELRSIGYSPYAEVIEAWRYKVPQHRQRLFVVAVQSGFKFDWPEPQSSMFVLGDAIGDLPKVSGGQRSETLDYHRRVEESELMQWFRRHTSLSEHGIIRDHVTRYVRPDDAEIFALMRPGQTYRDVPGDLRRYRADIFDDRYYRLSMNDLSRSITAHLAKDGYGFIHPLDDRTISVREAARIQTFPDDFRFAGHPTNRFKQIGNAVPPLLAKSIGIAVADALSKGNQAEDKEQSGLREALANWHSKAGRNYPWREDGDPWHVLLTEMCLHRTRADQVAAAFPRLIEVAGTPDDLISNWADVNEVVSHLGLKWRADNMLLMANLINERFGGEVPSSWHELTALPGVGDYVASATMCFAFAKDSVLLDTNTNRIARRWVGESSLRPWQARKVLFEHSGPEGPDAQWNYMLLDLGALVCTARTPQCGLCPVSGHCQFRKEVG